MQTIGLVRFCGPERNKMLSGESLYHDSVFMRCHRCKMFKEFAWMGLSGMRNRYKCKKCGIEVIL